MSTIELSEKNFESTVSAQGVVLVDFWAAWCGPCRAFAPVFEAASARHQGVTFAKVDTDAEQGIASAFEIRSIPTLMAFRDGVLVFAQPGMMSAAGLDRLVEKVQELDMDEVRRKLDREA